MKICPFCEGEIRDSVIRCVHCGRSFADPPEAQGASVGAASSDVFAGASAQTGQHPPLQPIIKPMPTPPTPWATRAGPPGRPNLGARRALPVHRRSWGPDVRMLISGIAAMACGVLAFLAVSDRWVHLTVTQAATEAEEGQILQLTLRGDAAVVGTAGTALAIALAAFGAARFLFGFQRGWTMPGITNPGFAMLVTIAGLGAAFLASTVWYVWEDAMVERARRAGLSSRAMRELLDHQPNPHVEIERLSGLTTFAGMMALGLVVSCVAWWAYRRRDA